MVIVAFWFRGIGLCGVITNVFENTEYVTTSTNCFVFFLIHVIKTIFQKYFSWLFIYVPCASLFSLNSLISFGLFVLLQPKSKS